MPKLQMEAGKGKKRVQIEMRRRQFLEVDIPSYLQQKYNITSANMAPPDPRRKQHFLPLDLFDDHSFETRLV